MRMDIDNMSYDEEYKNMDDVGTFKTCGHDYHIFVDENKLSRPLRLILSNMLNVLNKNNYSMESFEDFNTKENIVAFKKNRL
ncbi:unnamed protein product [Lupinus luteus]|uniref:Uncharacterized protein n=1 Tax=Lupinus luteus TaxID=3873 RepID=A0AAV1YPD7_LUPLU